MLQVHEIMRDVCSHANPWEYFDDVYLYNRNQDKADYYAAARIIRRYLIDEYNFDFDYYRDYGRRIDLEFRDN